MARKTNLKEFEDVFPKLEKVLLEQAASYNLPKAYLEWYQKVNHQFLPIEPERRKRKS